MAEFVMPSLGADMTSGKLMQWLVSPGDEVKHGDIVAVIETDKGAIDVEIYQDGTVQQLLVTEGTTVAVGAPLAMLGGGALPAAPAPTPAVVTPVAPAAPIAPVQLAAPALALSGNGRGRVHASPLARRRADELGLDIALIPGTRPGGAICAADVERLAASRPAPVVPTPPAPEVVAPVVPVPAAEVVTAQPAEVVTAQPVDRARAMRSAIAAAMSRANRDIPHYYLATDIDMKRALDWLAETNAKRSVADRLIYAALLIKAVALAVDKVPEINGFYREDGFDGSNAVHVGVAISLRQGGLVAPAIHDTDSLTLDEIMAGLRDLIVRARGGKLRSSELSDPTITVTNLGEQGVPAVYGVIYPPQVALVGFGKIVDRPWVIDGMLGVRPIMTGTLAADHRATDGHRGGIYLAEIERLLQEPEKL